MRLRAARTGGCVGLRFLAASPDYCPSPVRGEPLKPFERRTEYLTLGWNVIGVFIVIFAAIKAQSVALSGFGLDSLNEIGASTKTANPTLGSTARLVQTYLGPAQAIRHPARPLPQSNQTIRLEIQPPRRSTQSALMKVVYYVPPLVRAWCDRALLRSFQLPLFLMQMAV